MKRKGDQGFTLIELLVVISIIGMLSSIVLASVNTARLRAKDTAIKSSMLQLRLLHQQSFATRGDYYDWQFTDTALQGCTGLNGYSCAIGGTLGATCAQVFGSVINTPNIEAQRICDRIVSLISNTDKTHIGLALSNSTPGGIINSYSVGAYLPYKETYFCIGKSGTSDTETAYMTGIVEPNVSEPLGCSQNP